MRLLAVGLVLAMLVNLGLFTLMQHMTSSKSIEHLAIENIQLLDFVRLKRDPKVDIRKRELPKKSPLPEKPLPPPKAPVSLVNKPKALTPKLDAPRIDVPLNMVGGPYIGSFYTAPVEATVPLATPITDDQVVPLVLVPPQYPRMASRRGIEGVVTVSFTITKDGQVRDPIVMSAKPENVFDKAALKAILKWKFKPGVIERQATQEIEFKLVK